ncbi:MAG: TRAP transporter substrate-binding protein [Paracoccaceae bacterium]
MKRRTFTAMAASAALATGLFAMSSGAALAADVTLKLHQFLPPVATLPKHLLKPWGEELEAASGGSIKIQHFDAMALGGRPPELMQQAQDGAVDIVMTVVGYTPGRFPRTEVVELPFMMTDTVGTSLALQQLVEEDFQANEYNDVKVLAAWVHGPGLIHSREGVKSLEDMEGLKVRGPTRVINNLLTELGAQPIGMPLPAIPEGLSKGVINATVIPWEVTPSIKLAELVQNHTEFSGDASLYTAAIIMVMNKAKYESLTDEQRAVLDSETGAKLSARAAKIMVDYDKPGRDIATNAGNKIDVLDEAEVARWKTASEPVVATWIAEMKEKGIDGEALIARTKALIAENTPK